jgi:hypothetical protein
MWSYQPDSDESGLSFGLEGEGIQAAPVWHFDLPADPVGASAHLEERDALIEASQAALEDVPERVDRLVEGSRLASSGRISFDLESSPALPEPEADLLASLQALNAPLLGVSFGMEDEGRNKLEEAVERFDSDMDRLLRQVTNFAWVETQVGDQLLARTIVQWDGDAGTAWRSGLAVKEYQDHQHSLTQALATRNILLHALIVTVQSAAKITALIVTPGGVLLALPLAWKFVNQILSDIEKFQNLKKIAPPG